MPRTGRGGGTGKGKPKGYKHQDTLGKQEYERQLRTRIGADLEEYYDAFKLAAKGVTHMMAREKDGKWVEVTDPEVMVRVLNSGDTFYRISARNPDVRALIDAFNRLAGLPTQALEVSGKDGEPIVIKWQS